MFRDFLHCHFTLCFEERKFPLTCDQSIPCLFVLMCTCMHHHVAMAMLMWANVHSSPSKGTHSQMHTQASLWLDECKWSKTPLAAQIIFWPFSPLYKIKNNKLQLENFIPFLKDLEAITGLETGRKSLHMQPIHLKTKVLLYHFETLSLQPWYSSSYPCHITSVLKPHCTTYVNSVGLPLLIKLWQYQLSKTGLSQWPL